MIEAHFGPASVGIVVRADRGKQFVALIARNVFDPRLIASILDAFPGLSPEDWAPEPSSIADLKQRPGEIIWSALLPPSVVDEILTLVPWTDS